MRERKGRRSIRLKGWNYANSGWCFVTVDIQNKLELFGEINRGKIILNQAGMMIKDRWDEIPKFYVGVGIDKFCVMPDHVHGIILIENCGRTPTTADRWESIRTNLGVGVDSHIDPGRGSDSKHERIQGSARTENLSLAEVIQRFKILTTNIYSHGVRENNWPKFYKRLWQRNYYERVIRDRVELDRIRLYIENNPKEWK